MVRRYRVHKVGVAAATVGLLAVYLLPFVSVSRSRIATGEHICALRALSPMWAIALGVPWLLAVAFSMRDGRVRSAALGRGAAAVLAAVLPFAAAGAAAPALTARTGEFARVSIGSGVWVSAFMAYAIVLASRRELGERSPLAWAVALAAPVCVVGILASGMLDGLGVIVEYRNLGERYWAEVAIQLALAGAAILAATVIGVSLGLLAYAKRGAERPVFAVVNLFQTVPGLALIGLLVVPFAALASALPALRRLGIGGLGWAPVVTALTLYALLPIVRNTFEGLRGVPRATKEAGLGMGMTAGQLMRKVELPIAIPVLFSGVRTSGVQTVGNATLGAFAAAGGLGLLVFQGLAEQAIDLVVLGSVSIVALALLVDAIMRIVERLLTPAGLRREGGAR